MANRDAALLMDRDPTLTSPRGLAIKVLLELFDRGEGTRTLGAG